MTICPAAQSIRESFAKEGTHLSDPEAAFAEVVLWYDGFQDEKKLSILKHSPDDIEVLVAKMNSARGDRDYKTSDSIRDALRRAGLDFRAKNKS